MITGNMALGDMSLRLDEWSSLCNLVDVINKTYTSLDSAQPCYYGDDHMNQLGWHRMPPVPRQLESVRWEQCSIV